MKGGQVLRVVRARWFPAALLVIAVLAPFHQLLTGQAIPVPDDMSVSDLADGEFPARVEAGRLVREGNLPIWTPRLLTGFPIILDPLSVALFAALPPARALGLLIGMLLVVAATGTYALARRLGASRSGAFLAGFAFAWSGFVVCQLRHLSIIATVACFPWALYCLEQACTGGANEVTAARAVPLRRRLLWLTAFGGVFGLQVLGGFPQSVYISALVYAGLLAFRAIWLLGPRRQQPWNARLAPAARLVLASIAAAAIGILIGMATLLPMWELGALSDRGDGVTYEFATQLKYYLPSALSFIVPYIKGDISDRTYRGYGIFWEDYGYVGLVTLIGALLTVVVHVRRLLKSRAKTMPRQDVFDDHPLGIRFWIASGLIAYLMVLGAATPFYPLAFNLLPGFDRFRVATRFLFVVELALAILGGVGLSHLQQVVARRAPRWGAERVAAIVGVVLVCVAVVDLVGHNRRQVPLHDSERWLATPVTASAIQKRGASGRVYSPNATWYRLMAFKGARGSSDLAPYYLHRDLLQPNSNLLHGLSTVDAYTGISPSWAVDLVGDYNRSGLLSTLSGADKARLHPLPAYYDWLEALSVQWLLLRVPVDSDRLEFVGGTPYAGVYRLKGTLPRARFAPRVRLIPRMEDVARLSIAGTLDPRQEVVLHEAAALRAVLAAQADPGAAPGEARIIVDRATEVVIEARTERGGLLVLADQYYPGWRVSVDGRAQPILRVNVMQRGVAVRPGTHRVAFEFRSEAVRRGWLLTGVGVALLVGAALALTLGRDRRSQTMEPGGTVR